MRRLFLLLFLFTVLASGMKTSVAWACVFENGYGGSRSLQPPSNEVVKRKTLAWLASRGVDAKRQAKARKLWDGKVGSDQLLDRLAKTLALGDPRVADLVGRCVQARRVDLPKGQWLVEKAGKNPLDPFAADNLRLYYGRWLARNRLYEEALEQFRHLKPEQVVDPASLLFFQGVCHHSLLEKKLGLAALSRLLDEVRDPPVRYRTVANLMREDLQSVQGDTLDYAARLMSDAERRLRLGRAGKRVRKVEDDVVEILNKLIARLENRDDKRPDNPRRDRQSKKPSIPLETSRIVKSRDDLDNDDVRKKFSYNETWGDFPPKKRQEVLQRLGRDFPAHYRAAIEQYFRRLAQCEGK